MRQRAANGQRRPRDAAATRHALLLAAQELFAKLGYEATTVRAVADKAGVNQALLFRYFGNKRGLFLEAVQSEALDVLDGPQEGVLERCLTALLTTRPDRSSQILMALLRASDSEQVGEEVRTKLGAAYSAAFAAQAVTDDPRDAAVRGELMLAWVLGIALSRPLLPDGPLYDGAGALAHMLRASDALLGK